MTTTDEQPRRREHGRHFLIPAGVLIGLGVGLIAGYVVPGILIGLGLGLAISSFTRPGAEATMDASIPSHPHGNPWVSGIVGIFLILLGAAFIWAPQNLWSYIWPYGIGIFFILLGLSFVAKMWHKSG